jgi:diguanylate cyclase (GGDEF)-like protein
MERLSIAVFTARKDLRDFLEQTCPEFDFRDGLGPDGPAADVALFDDDSLGERSRAGADSGSSIALVRTGASGGGFDLEADRRTFLSQPAAFLGAAGKLARTRSELRSASGKAAALEHLQELLSISDTHVLCERIAREVIRILQLSYGTMLMHDPKMERFVTTFSDDPDHFESSAFLPGVMPSMIQDAMSSGAGYAYDAARDGVEGLLVIPVLMGDDVIGVLKLVVPERGEPAPARIADAVGYVRTVTSILTNAYQLTRSRELALRDDLTRAFNRRFFESYLQEEMERARRYKSALSIIFLDLDDLKAVNNAHGHMAGSRTLQEVAKRIMGAVRTIDKVVRFGGDEFCIILPQTDQTQATGVAARVRDAIVAGTIDLEQDLSVRITASFGIASYPLHANTKEDLVSAADAAMLLVKSTTKDEIGVARAALAGEN